jgi:hypothetical protein
VVASLEDQKQPASGKGRLEGAGLLFADGQTIGGSLAFDAKSEKATPINSVKAAEIALFTCRAGTTVSDLMGKMDSGQIMANGGGANGETGINAQEQAAFAATQVLINGGTIKEAKHAAEQAIRSFPNDANDETEYIYIPSGAGRGTSGKN